MNVLPKPAHPLDVWLGGKAPSELRRVGRLADGWLASFTTPEQCKAARVTVEEAADAAGREIDPEHFGVMALYTHDAIPDAFARRSPPAIPMSRSTTSSPAAGRACTTSARATSRSASRSSCSSRSASPTNWDDELAAGAEALLPLCELS